MRLPTARRFGPGHDYWGSGSYDLVGGLGDDTINGQDGISGNHTVDGGDGTDACTFDPGDIVLNCP
ncbi:MAG: hypothetical protein QOH48_2355 [Actinomycetota bacterium]|jgi:hypothetical protein|nr:hypothetical protein [Actinomycetota bacterium]